MSMDASEPEEPQEIPRSERSVLHEWAAVPVPAISPIDDPSLTSELRCMLALSSELLGYGLPVHRVEESILRLARAFGQRATVMGFPTSLLVTLHAPQGTSMHSVRAQPGVVHLARLDALHRVVGRIERHELDPAGAIEEIRAVVRAPRPRAAALEIVCAGLVGGGGALLLGGSHVDSLIAALLAMATGALAMFASLHPTLTRVTPVLAAFLVTLVSAGLAHAAMAPHPLIVTMASLLVLLPGLTLTLAMVELATGHLVCGTARMIGAVTTFMQLGFGTLLGVRLGALAAVEPIARDVPPLWLEASGAASLALGFAGLLSVRAPDALGTALVSAFAWGTSRVLLPHLGSEIGVLMSAIGVGLVSNLFARRNDRPSSVLLVPGITMLVPGSLGMLSISSALLHDSGRALATVIDMLNLVMALSTGVLIAAAVIPPRTEH
jgi:uncharacterized membrane protein YjjP (DUF1212 family)